MGKQAVLFIHGIGEQRPMDTLRGFVRQAWTRNQAAHRPGFDADAVWSKPYPLSQDFELRRLTTPTNASDVRTDFYELYWAHLMRGTQWHHLFAWMRTLLWRRPGTVPAGLLLAYWVLWILLGAGFLALLVYSGLTTTGKVAAPGWFPPWLSWLAGVALLPAVGWVATQVVGDAARYLNVAAENVQMRHAIRSAGLQVLNALHQKQYERIVVVGHSLGTVIGYDILCHAWSQWNAEPGTTDGGAAPSLEAVDQLAQQMGALGGVPLSTWQAAQRQAARDWAAQGRTWRVTDFVTLGSPLAHAAILLAKDAKDLATKFKAREYATCPPTLETRQQHGEPVHSFLYRDGARSIPHHAALFGLTRWTNLYFPCKWLVVGDLIGGPVAPVFGAGVKDVAVRTDRQGGLLTHTLYWADEAGKDDTHLASLLVALDVAELGTAAPGTISPDAGAPSAVHTQLAEQAP